jgi:DUF1365 family protein
MALLDISQIPSLMSVSAFTSYNRWNWASFHESDHFGDPQRPLRERLEEDARRHGHTLSDGPVYLLTHLRYLGYCFNPVSFFYCYGSDGRLRLVLAEVNNTFGQSHNYWLVPGSRPGGGGAADWYEAVADKTFYVSPFMPPDMRYAFTFTSPAERLVVRMSLSEADDAAPGRSAFDATLSLAYRPWSAAEIRRTLTRYPLMSTRVIAAIHWEALRLWSKGLPLYDRARADA